MCFGLKFKEKMITTVAVIPGGVREGAGSDPSNTDATGDWRLVHGACWSVSLVWCFFISSPEHKVLRVSYCDRPLSAVRRLSCVVRRA